MRNKMNFILKKKITSNYMKDIRQHNSKVKLSYKKGASKRFLVHVDKKSDFHRVEGVQILNFENIPFSIFIIINKKGD